MLRLIYLKVFLRAQTLDAWILLVWRISILEFLVFTVLWGFLGVRKNVGFMVT